MNYATGEESKLGDHVTVPGPSGVAPMRGVMLGGRCEHLEMDAGPETGQEDRKLDDAETVLEWIGENPFVHDDPRYAPVGHYMFSGADEYLIFQCRGGN